MYLPKFVSRSTLFRWLAPLIVFLVVVLGVAMPARAQNRIITWGANTQEWNRELGLDAFRLGCSGAPGECISQANRIARGQGIDRVFLAILFNAARTSNDARTYSQLSLNHPILYEVGFDDFVSQCQRQKMSFLELSATLRDVAWQLKSSNPNLQFGLTIYTDQISSTSFPLMDLHLEFRQRVDYVHLYPHYRKEAERFAVAVQKIQMIFPNAKVIGGVYAYDRRDYLPCARGSSAPCSNDEELSLFKQSFQERWAMLMNGKISLVEFYPGSFGLEKQWRGWQHPRSCRADRRQECIANTQAMRQMVREILHDPSFLNATPRYGTRPK